MIIIACGGRSYHNAAVVNKVLSDVHAKTPITLLVNGGATGADRLAERWAKRHGIPTKRECADWRRYGDRAAGPIRNKLMLMKYDPELVVSFPGGAGTADMRRLASATCTKQIVVTADWPKRGTEEGLV